VTGNTYYIEITPYGGDAIGYEAYRFDRSEDAYPHGHAYSNRNPRPEIDLSMTIMEYADATPPTMERLPAWFTHQIIRRAALANDVFTIRNTGGGMLNYSISDDANWLSTNPVEGSSMGETDNINVIYNTASLAIGSHTGTITINAPGATNPTETVMVYLTVTPPPFAPCDFDQDHDVDQADFGRFQRCYSGAGNMQTDPACEGAKLDSDDDVDSGDFGAFMGCMTGPGVEANTLCAG